MTTKKFKIDGTVKCAKCGFEHPCKVRTETDGVYVCSNTKDYKQFQERGGLDSKCRDTSACLKRRLNKFRGDSE